MIYNAKSRQILNSENVNVRILYDPSTSRIQWIKLDKTTPLIVELVEKDGNDEN